MWCFSSVNGGELVETDEGNDNLSSAIHEKARFGHPTDSAEHFREHATYMTGGIDVPSAAG